MFQWKLSLRTHMQTLSPTFHFESASSPTISMTPENSASSQNYSVATNDAEFGRESEKKEPYRDPNRLVNPSLSKREDSRSSDRESVQLRIRASLRGERKRESLARCEMLSVWGNQRNRLEESLPVPQIPLYRPEDQLSVYIEKEM